jgi:hypothetical protein
MEPNFVIGIDPELARVLILIGLVATVGALLIAVATMATAIHIALNVYRDGAAAGCAGSRNRAKREFARSHLVGTEISPSM